jgi:hypothetical protein
LRSTDKARERLKSQKHDSFRRVRLTTTFGYDNADRRIIVTALDLGFTEPFANMINAAVIFTLEYDTSANRRTDAGDIPAIFVTIAYAPLNTVIV